MRLVFDLETPLIGPNRELPSEVLCAVVQDVDTEKMWTFAQRAVEGVDARLNGMLELLESADLLIGHNIAGFDLPVLERAFGWEPSCPFVDTLAVSRMTRIATLLKTDAIARKAAVKGVRGDVERYEAMEAVIPSGLMGLHKLEAWGHRLGLQKGEFGKSISTKDWKLCREMVEYCQQDVRLNTLLFHHLLEEGAEKGWPAPPVEAMVVESAFARLMQRQEENGVGFDEEAAHVLEGRLLARQAELAEEIRPMVQPWLRPDGVTTPKRDQESRKYSPGEVGYRNVATGAPYTRLKAVEFKPGSRVHIADALIRRGWKPDPEEITDQLSWVAGRVRPTPRINERILSDLDPELYPFAPACLEGLMLSKRLGQLALGRKAWLKVVRGGKIHGRVNATGARTTRASHIDPNLAQVPKVKSPYGRECRGLFRPTREDWVMVGADASQLELRMLGHYLYVYDEGAFIHDLLNSGDDGIHKAWQRATGLFFVENQKTLTYADLYGAGDEKRGKIVIADMRDAVAAGMIPASEVPGLEYASDIGKSVKAKLLAQVPALEYLLKDCKRAFKRGYVRGLDGRIIPTESEHGTLNDVLQSAGAIVMKYAAVKFDTCWRLVPGWAPMLNVHDEAQFEACSEDTAQKIGIDFCEAIEAAGAALELKCPLAGEWKVGETWADTH